MITSKEYGIETTTKKQVNNTIQFDLPFNLNCLIFQYYNIDELFTIRLINKKFNKIVKATISQNFLSDKTNCEIYKKYYFVFNEKLNTYLKLKIIPYLKDADTLFNFLGKENAAIYFDFIQIFEDEITMEINEFNGHIKVGYKFQCSIKRIVNKCLCHLGVKNLSFLNIIELDFSESDFYRDGIIGLNQGVLMYNNIQYGNLSKSVIEGDDICNVINMVDKKKGNFELELDNIYGSKKHLKMIQAIVNNNFGKRIIISKKYNGLLKQIKPRKHKK